MNRLKRTISGLAALVVMLSNTPVMPTVIAEESGTLMSTEVQNQPSYESTSKSTAEEDATEDENLNEQEDIDFTVSVPEKWTNSVENWITVNDPEVSVFYKICSENKSDWGEYTDEDVKSWNSGALLESGEGYIKFWFVKNNVVKTDEPMHYQYDAIEPDSFNLIKKKHGENDYYIYNQDSIKDNLSNEFEVFYSVGRQLLDSKEEIRNLERVSVNGGNFVIKCRDDMINNDVIVYIIDEAGNIQYSEIRIQNSDKPTFSISGIDSQWTNTLNWSIGTNPSEGVSIYFATSEKNIEKWGNYTSAQKWDSTWKSEDLKEIIPEGENYIHFWAVFDDGLHDENQETWQYKFDCTAPIEYEVELSEPRGNWWYRERTLKSSTPIYDSVSGIKQVTYTINGGNEQWITYNGDNKFEINIDNNQIEGKEIVVYVWDNAGNKQSYTINNDDTDAPIIDKLSIVSIKSDNDKLQDVAKDVYEYGHELSIKKEYFNGAYANENDYLRVDFDEKSPKNIVVSVNSKLVEYSLNNKEEGEKQGIRLLYDDSKPNTCVCFIPINSFNDKLNRNTINQIDVKVNDFSQGSKLSSLKFVYDPKDVSDSVIAQLEGQEENVKILNNAHFYGKDFSDTIKVNISDKNGIKNYSIYAYDPQNNEIKILTINKKDISKGIKSTEKIEIDVENADEEENTTISTETSEISYMVPYTTYTTAVDIDSTICAVDGEYKIVVKTEDLAGNENQAEYVFYVDTTSPVIIEEKYTYNPSILNYLSFGIFGNNTVDISVTIEENELGCGIDIDNVYLKWDGKNTNASSTDNKTFEFKQLPLGKDGVPYIRVTDKLGNYSNYYFTTQNGELAKQNEVTKTTLTLENTIPEVAVVLPETDKHIINDEIWYPSAIDYSVSAIDADAGLNNVSVKRNSIKNDGALELLNEINENGINTESGYTKFESMSSRYNEKVNYTYHITDEGVYQILVNAVDNAGNSYSDGFEGKWYTQNLNIDTRNPEITEFMFSDKFDNVLTDVEKGTYGFYFVDDTTVKVFVKDEGISSGIDYVILYSRDVNGQENNYKVYSSDTEKYHVENGISYAEFTVKKGFKGQIWALVADKVASVNPSENDYVHTSGLKYADGNIIEDAEMHKREDVSSITISEDIVTNKTDSDGIPLYNTSIPLTINVKDTFSGISKIEWSIANDGTSGTIDIDNNGNYVSDSNLLSIVEDSIKRDSNLITEFNFNLTVSSNTNSNEVYIKLTDRSGNESEATKKYSIDTTAPSISATLSNNNPSNERYYNTDQTITVVITERNFNASDVKCMLNGTEQAVGNWTVNGSGDATQNIGTFSINSDGDYSFTITFTDMAGNSAEAFSQSMFVVDKTAPVLKTNFDEFKTKNEEHFFGIDSINKTAEITIIEHNFSAESANVRVYKKDSGSTHDMNSMDSHIEYGWEDDGDTHILKITFNENDDGVYYIKVAPSDLASNTAESEQTVVFEVDFTNPIIVERNDLYVSDKEESYDYLEVYNEKNGADDGFLPSVSFDDINFDHLEYELTVYTPEYKNGKEIGAIIPETNSGNVSDKTYSLLEFAKDGVYSFDVTAVDKAGNRSIISRNTSVMMMDTDVLAYISNSNKNKGTGWYSLQKDENIPISKRPDSFSDLDITVFAQKDSATSLILRDENGESKDTGVTADDSDDMYAVGVYNYTLPRSYFVDNYPEGTNKDLYLWAENTLNDETSHITLGWIRIDALAPTCSVPSDLKNWKSYTSSTKTITLSNISESLDVTKCVVYDNKTEISQDNFVYSDDDDTLSYTLDKGWHDISFVLVDEAGNACTIQEISSIQVGLLYCLWFRILCGIIIAAGIVVTIILIKKKKSVSR